MRAERRRPGDRRLGESGTDRLLGCVLLVVSVASLAGAALLGFVAGRLPHWTGRVAWRGPPGRRSGGSPDGPAPLRDVRTLPAGRVVDVRLPARRRRPTARRRRSRLTRGRWRPARHAD